MPKFCPTCGKSLPFENAEICPNCGVRIKSPITPKKQDSGRNVTLLIAAGIGIVLLVVIVAAVIAAFVFGMSGNISKTKVVAVTAQQTDSNHILITYQGGQDAYTLKQLTATVTDTTGNSQTKNIEPSGQTTSLEVGSSVIFTGSFSGKDHVIAYGAFSDGTQQVLLDTYV
jgi:FlaG/FlaF family flagellin (archaellin)